MVDAAPAILKCTVGKHCITLYSLPLKFPQGVPVPEHGKMFHCFTTASCSTTPKSCAVSPGNFYLT